MERLAERLDLSAPTITFHLKKLMDAGAVESQNLLNQGKNIPRERSISASPTTTTISVRSGAI